MRWLLLVVVVASCKQSVAPPAAVPTPHAGMAQLLADATAARNALIAGDISRARRHLDAVAKSKTPPGLPEGSKPSLEAVRTAAAEGHKSTTPEGLGPAIAKVGAACGGCHRAFGSGPGLFAPPDLPQEGSMARHAWAADRMWEGLIAPSTERYKVGATSLLTEAGSDEGLYAGLDPSKMRSASILHKLVHEGAEQAVSTDDEGRRVELYGALIGACAECHAISGGP